MLERHRAATHLHLTVYGDRFFIRFECDRSRRLLRLDVRRIAAWRGLSFDEAERSYAGLNLPDVAGNRSYLDTGGERGILRAARELNALMLRAGRIKVADDLVGLIDPGFLPHNGGVP